MRQQAINDAKGLTLKKGKEIMYEYGLGVSSEAILGTHLGKKDHNYDHPLDRSDLMRCIGVTRVMKIDINIMRDTTYIWNRILKQWDTLVDLYLKGESNQINDLLRKIRNKPKTSLEHIEECDFIISINRMEMPEGCDTVMKMVKNR